MKSDDIRIERLAGLARIWGAVTFFHPDYPVEGVDWDAATVDAIEATRAATGKDDYAKAVGEYLSALGDADTQMFDRGAEEQDPGAPNPDMQASSLGVDWADDKTALVRFSGFTDMGPSGAAQVQAAIEELAEATAVVLDLRRLTWTAEMVALSPIVSSLLAEDLPLPTKRRRRHAGYAPESGRSSGGYESMISIVQPPLVQAQAGALAKTPMAVVADRGQTATAFASALHLAGRAAVVLVGERPDQSGGDEATFIELPEDLVAVVRTGDTVNPDGTTGTRADVVVHDPEGPTGLASSAVQVALDLLAGRPTAEPVASLPPAILKPLVRPQMPSTPACPTTGWRLLALFKHWTVIRWFFPYLDLCDRPWDDVLAEFIPVFEQADTDVAYALAVARLHTRIQDTHGYIAAPALREHIGTHYPAVAVTEVEGRTVVTYVEGCDEISVGDIVVSIDGRPAAERISELGELFAASTPQALSWRVHNEALAGKSGSDAVLEILGDGSEQTKLVTVVRDRESFRASPRATAVFSVLPEGVGYVDLARLTLPDVDAAFEAIAGTPAVIFDMRGYPNGTAWAIAPRLAGRSVPAARIRRRDLSSPAVDHETTTEFVQWCPSPAPGEPRYDGRVVVLIDGTAISQAEHTCLFIEAAAPETVFVGTPTNGANGDVTSFTLPGGIRCMFTGQSIEFVDGRQLQRKGVQPHVEAQPTIAGLRAGRDEVLEAGVAAALAPPSAQAS